MLVTRETDLEIALSQKVEIQTSAKPANPPIATSEQTTNSVVIRIQSFDASQVCFNTIQQVRIAKKFKIWITKHLINQTRLGYPGRCFSGI